jgi:hypothetical protein
MTRWKVNNTGAADKIIQTLTRKVLREEILTATGYYFKQTGCESVAWIQNNIMQAAVVSTIGLLNFSEQNTEIRRLIQRLLASE